MGRPAGQALLQKLDASGGLPAGVQQRFVRDACALIDAEELTEPASCFRFVTLEGSDGGALRAEGETLYGPRLIPASGRLTGLACGVATIGPALERRVSALFAERKMSLALALDQVGNRLLLEESRKLQDSMLVHARRLELSMAGELRPGDPGLALSAQAAVLRLADAARIAVALSSGQALTPLKSVSVVMGAGIDLPPATWSRCDDCRSRATCKIAGDAAVAT